MLSSWHVALIDQIPSDFIKYSSVIKRKEVINFAHEQGKINDTKDQHVSMHYLFFDISIIDITLLEV